MPRHAPVDYVGILGARQKMAATANIIRKIEVVEGGGHHGGGWKVAYADFMTAMMAFFLLLWILSSSDEQKLRGIAEYFTNATMPGGSGVLDGATLGPPGTLTASNGAVVARGSELGKVDDPSPAKWEIKDVTPTASPTETRLGTNLGDHENPAAGAPSEIVAEAESTDVTGKAASEGAVAGSHDADSEAEVQLSELEREVYQAMQNNPDLRPLMPNVVFEETPAGLQIQIIDQDGKPMFASGRADLPEATSTLLATLGTSLSKLDNKLVISGHTDAVPFSKGGNYDNWDLSSDRAHATRRVFEASGVTGDRIIRVSGMAASDPLVVEDPKHASNRRVSILVQRAEAAQSRQQAEVEKANESSPEIVTAEEIQETVVASATQVADTSPLQANTFKDLRDALR